MARIRSIVAASDLSAASDEVMRTAAALAHAADARLRGVHAVEWMGRSLAEVRWADRIVLGVRSVAPLIGARGMGARFGCLQSSFTRLRTDGREPGELAAS